MTPTPVDVYFEYPERPGAEIWFRWDWLADTQRSLRPIISRGTSPVRTHGVVASVVERDGSVLASARDAAAFLRLAITMVDTPYMRGYDPAEGFIAGCVLPGCLIWPPRFDDRINPGDWMVWRNDPAPILVDGGHLAQLHGQLFGDVTEGYSPELVGLLESGAFAFLPRYERSSQLDAASSAPVGVLVPREGSGYARPIHVVEVAGRLTVESMPTVDEFGTSLSVLSSKGRAIYSAQFDTVYFIGGEDLSGLAGLRRYSFALGYTTEIPVNVTEAEVAAMAVDPLRHRAYVLFLDRGDGKARARIAAIELNGGGSRNLLEVPYDGEANRRVGLSVGPKGELVILADRAGESVAGWMYEVLDDGLAFVGAWTTGGTLVDAPHPSYLSFVLDQGGELSQWTLSRADFGLVEELEAL